MLQTSSTHGNGKTNDRPRINDAYLYADFNAFPEITEEIREQNAPTGGVRISNSMYRTKRETDEYIKRSLKRKLP